MYLVWDAEKSLLSTIAHLEKKIHKANVIKMLNLLTTILISICFIIVYTKIDMSMDKLSIALPWLLTCFWTHTTNSLHNTLKKIEKISGPFLKIDIDYTFPGGSVVNIMIWSKLVKGQYLVVCS